MLGLAYSKSVFGTGHIVAISLLLRRTRVLLFPYAALTAQPLSPSVLPFGFYRERLCYVQLLQLLFLFYSPPHSEVGWAF